MNRNNDIDGHPQAPATVTLQDEADAEAIVEANCEAWRWGDFNSFSGTAEWGLAVKAGAAGIAFERERQTSTAALEAENVRGPRTDAEIMEQTNDLARQFYARRGYEVPVGYRFDLATHPHEVEAWDMACIAMEALTETDAQSVADDYEPALAMETTDE